MVKRLTHSLICGLALLLLASGCREVPAEGTMMVPPVTQPAADPIATATPSAEESLRLELPATVAPGEAFYVGVHNEGQVPYIFFPPDGDNCVEIAEAGGQRLPIPQTCDSLMAVIVQPGKQSYAGDWDLKRCAGTIN